MRSLTLSPPVCVECVEVPKLDECCDRVTDPSCVSHNITCAAQKEPLELALKAAKKTVDESRKSLEVAKGTLSTAQDVVDSAEKSLDAAVATLNAVQKTYKVGVEAIRAFSKFALTEIINIHKMYFKVELSVAKGGQFQCHVLGVLMGENINVANLDFDIRNPLKLAKSLGDRAISGLSNFIS